MVITNHPYYCLIEDTSEELESFKGYKEWVRGKSKSPAYEYKDILKKFCNFRDMTPGELIDEYLEDRKHEDPRDYGKPERKLRKYKEHLKEKVDDGDLSPATMKQHFSRIKSFCSFWDCELGFQIPKGEPISRKLTSERAKSESPWSTPRPFETKQSL